VSAAVPESDHEGTSGLDRMVREGLECKLAYAKTETRLPVTQVKHTRQPPVKCQSTEGANP